MSEYIEDKVQFLMEFQENIKSVISDLRTGIQRNQRAIYNIQKQEEEKAEEFSKMGKAIGMLRCEMKGQDYIDMRLGEVFTKVVKCIDCAYRIRNLKEPYEINCKKLLMITEDDDYCSWAIAREPKMDEVTE